MIPFLGNKAQLHQNLVQITTKTFKNFCFHFPSTSMSHSSANSNQKAIKLYNSIREPPPFELTRFTQNLRNKLEREQSKEREENVHCGSLYSQNALTNNVLYDFKASKSFVFFFALSLSVG